MRKNERELRCLAAYPPELCKILRAHGTAYVSAKANLDKIEDHYLVQSNFNPFNPQIWSAKPVDLPKRALSFPRLAIFGGSGEVRKINFSLSLALKCKRFKEEFQASYSL